MDETPAAPPRGSAATTALAPVTVSGWRVVRQALDALFVDEIRRGIPRLDSLSSSTRLIVITAAGLTLVTAISMLFGDWWRTSFDLVALPPGRGSILPLPLVPLTMFMLLAGWSLLLAGSLRVTHGVRTALLLLILIPVAGWLSLSGRSAAHPLVIWLSWLGLGAAGLYVANGDRLRTRPTRELGVVFACLAIPTLIANAEALNAWRLLRDAEPLYVLGLLSGWFFQLARPFLFRFGVDLAEGAHELSTWSARLLAAFGRVPIWFALGGFLAWRAWEVGFELSEAIVKSSALEVGLRSLGALGIPLGCWLLWRITLWRSAHGNVAAQPELGGISRTLSDLFVLIVLYQIPTVLPQLTLSAIELAPSSLPETFWRMAAEARDLAFALASRTDAVHLGVGLVALGESWFVASRGRQIQALVLGILGFRILWLQIPLPEPIQFRQYLYIDMWWVIGIIASALMLVARRGLTLEWAGRLLTLTMITELIVRVAWFNDPLAPLLGGIGLLVAMALRDALTSGAWANTDSRSFPRTSRIFLYLGYALISMTVIHWAVIVRNQETLDILTGKGVLEGFEVFGKPVLYAAIITTLGAAWSTSRWPSPMHWLLGLRRTLPGWRRLG